MSWLLRLLRQFDVQLTFVESGSSTRATEIPPQVSWKRASLSVGAGAPRLIPAFMTVWMPGVLSKTSSWRCAGCTALCRTKASWMPSGDHVGMFWTLGTPGAELIGSGARSGVVDA